MNAEARGADRLLLEQVREHLDRSSGRDAPRVDMDEGTWALRAVHQAQAVFEMLCLWPEMDMGVTTLPEDNVADVLRASGVRDVAMADNVLWLLEHQRANARMLIFAADGHVIADEHMGGLWTGHRGLGAAAGQHLRRALGPRYRVMLTCSSCVTSPPRRSSDTTLDAWLDAVPRESFVLSLLDAPPSKWLDREQSICTNGVYPQAFVPRRACDGIAYIRHMTPARRIAEP
jgi:erythromycin esterase